MLVVFLWRRSVSRGPLGGWYERLYDDVLKLHPKTTINRNKHSPIWFGLYRWPILNICCAWSEWHSGSRLPGPLIPESSRVCSNLLPQENNTATTKQCDCVKAKENKYWQLVKLVFLLTRFIRKKNLEKCCCKITEIKWKQIKEQQKIRDYKIAKWIFCLIWSFLNLQKLGGIVY